MKHGVMLPAQKAGQTPGRVVTVRSRLRSPQNSRIRLDKLLRSTKPKILIKRRLGGIGDVIMTTPILKALKDLIPGVHITYATDLQYAEGALGQVISHNPYADRLIPNEDIRDGEYDYAVDITATGLSREKKGTIPPNRIDMFAEEVGISVAADPVPVYQITMAEAATAQEEIKKLVPDFKEAKLIAVQARSNDVRRTWPLASVEELVRLLSEEPKVHVLLFDWGRTVSRWEDKETPKLHMMMNRSLAETAALIDQCDVVVCPDSSMLHLAGALNKKIVTIFGPIPPESRINHYTNASAICLRLLCFPCWYNPICSRGDDRLTCLTSITPEQVKEATMKKLAASTLPHRHIIHGKDLTSKKQDPVILVRRTTKGIGDILMTTPSLTALKTKYPGKEIHVACQKELWPALQNHPAVDKLLDAGDSFNYRRYHMVIDISSPCAKYESARIASGRSVQKSRVEIFAEAMDVRDLMPSLKPEYYVTPEEAEWAKDFLSKTALSKKPKLAVGLRSAEIYRDWPESHYSKLFALLKDKFEIVLIDHSREHLYENVIDACGFSLRRAIAITSVCEGLVTVDTSLLHFGAALNIPTVALFGPIDGKARCKGYDNVTVAVAGLECIPCWRNASTPCKKNNVIKGYSKCMEEMSPRAIAKLVTKKMR
jgi:ADP-heptose:LPS heptosyltransferase